MKNHPAADLSLRNGLWFAALAATIVFASGSPMPDYQRAVHFQNADKIAHFFVFGLLGTLVARIPWVQLRRPLGIYTAIVIVSVFGASDELHQHFTPSRSMDVWDWVTDTAGAALAVAVYAHWRWYRETLERSARALFKRRVEIAGEPCVIPANGFSRGENTDRGTALAGRAA